MAATSSKSSGGSGGKRRLVGAIDQGTTSTRFIVFDDEGAIVSVDQMEHEQITTTDGFVEHDAETIWKNTCTVIEGALRKEGISGDDIEAIGITNQRETVLIWDRVSGKPLYNAIVWMDSRGAPYCDAVAAKVGGVDGLRERTGLPLAPYFSASKLAWLLEHVEGVRAAVESGEAMAGTIDTWLVWKLTGGTDGGIHVTDVTNASRTLLMDLKTLAWDEELCRMFGLPAEAAGSLGTLPRICSSSEVYGHVATGALRGVAIAGILGDQQAALFGQACFREGQVKSTYGTGCFMLQNTGGTPVRSSHKLLTTVAYQLTGPGGERQPPVYALEGSVAQAGSVVQWLRDKMRLIEHASETEEAAASVADSGGLFLVPAFSGLLAPHWDATARGVLVGITAAASREHVIRAALESVCFQSAELLDCMERDSGLDPGATREGARGEVRVDGGMSANKLLLQMQADLFGCAVVRPQVIETTALGAAYAAGLAVGVWSGVEDLERQWGVGARVQPHSDKAQRAERMARWGRAVERSKGWTSEEARAARGVLAATRQAVQQAAGAVVEAAHARPAAVVGGVGLGIALALSAGALAAGIAIGRAWR
ncbi:hypothetical protein FNF27_01476 [Cafeteria roenbergensis]|uniref:glycerol kinase n=1 Tax=Cafeteria roenbergensis TaxID=33653 RepID=A0A5A8D7F0_CAFRO|nr:hypothetical protein FNF31_04253 [Cafeteria roenbergensis]KAA0163668.1 hypothetical protein FNF28_04145 [Cafeteria roenbergensis]KAA0177146.1 hypothetical protein FNF27_01476 [Cafeteria roenbergensis]|mmetsp:Transcript_5473/g.23150  ORF Transcript_5473/g.23150 Transcript_5473/m.23150 type:complete len:597 (-) Transcript_5473:24-1814(-)